MDTEPCPNIIIQNPNSPKIYRPKPIKLCISYKLSKKRFNNKNNSNNKHYPLTPVSNSNFNFKNNLNLDNNNKNERKKRKKKSLNQTSMKFLLKKQKKILINLR